MKHSELKQLIKEEIQKVVNDEYTDEEILERTTVAQLPDNWTLLNVISHYEDHILGYLRTSDIYGQELN